MKANVSTTSVIKLWEGGLVDVKSRNISCANVRNLALSFVLGYYMCFVTQLHKLDETFLVLAYPFHYGFMTSHFCAWRGCKRSGVLTSYVLLCTKGLELWKNISRCFQVTFAKRIVFAERSKISIVHRSDSCKCSG